MRIFESILSHALSNDKHEIVICLLKLSRRPEMPYACQILSTTAANEEVSQIRLSLECL